MVVMMMMMIRYSVFVSMSSFLFCPAGAANWVRWGKGTKYADLQLLNIRFTRRHSSFNGEMWNRWGMQLTGNNMER